jgi:hypothetical protein
LNAALCFLRICLGIFLAPLGSCILRFLGEQILS